MMPELLLVDDEEDILDFLGRILNNKYSISCATNGAEALELMSQKDIELIITDVMMPVMDGFEFCKIVKSSFEHGHIPVILLTAKNTIQSKVEGLELGADAYIEKPFAKEFLLAQIASLLSNRSMMKQYFTTSPLVHLQTIGHTKADKRFLEYLGEVINLNIEDTELDVEKLAKLMNMSRITLYRKIKAVSDLSPNELINLIRLKKAATLLAEGDYKIYEVAGIAGFSSQSNFTRSFIKEFKMTPTEFLNQKQTERINKHPGLL